MSSAGIVLNDGRELSAVFRGHPLNDAMKNGNAPDGKPMIGIRCVRDVTATAR